MLGLKIGTKFIYTIILLLVFTFDYKQYWFNQKSEKEIFKNRHPF